MRFTPRWDCLKYSVNFCEMEVVAFDLDDTLFPEIDYLHSAYREIALILSTKYTIAEVECCNAMINGGFDALMALLDYKGIKHNEDVMWCVEKYRHHVPTISLSPDTEMTLTELKRRGYSLALITDGRVITQSLKIDGLGLHRYFSEEDVSISEQIGADKTSPLPFRAVMLRHPDAERYVYVGDNPKKDFFQPNALGWTTIGLRDRGRNIHKQTLDLPIEYQPQHWVDNLSEIFSIL